MLRACLSDRIGSCMTPLRFGGAQGGGKEPSAARRSYRTRSPRELLQARQIQAALAAGDEVLAQAADRIAGRPYRSNSPNRSCCASQSAGNSWFFSQRSVSVFSWCPARSARTICGDSSVRRSSSLTELWFRCSCRAMSTPLVIRPSSSRRCQW